MTQDDREQLGADLSAYLDGELSPERTRDVEQLLAESAEARELLDALRGVSLRLGELPRVEPPADLAQRVARHYERVRAARTASTRTRRMRFWNGAARVIASAAALALCFYSGWFMHARSAGQRATPSGEAAELSVEARERSIVAQDVDRDKADAPMIARRVDTPVQEEMRVPSEALDALKALGYVGGHEEDDQTLTEPRYARAARTAGKPAPSGPSAVDDATEGTPVAAYTLHDQYETDVVGRELGEQFGKEEAAPSIQVVVTPQDAEQYAAALRAVSSWEGQERRTDAAITRSPAASEDGASSPEQQITLEVPPENVTGLLDELEQQTPSRVSVALNFRPVELTQVQEIVQPEARYARVTEEPAEKLGAPFVDKDAMNDAPEAASLSPPAPMEAQSPAYATHTEDSERISEEHEQVVRGGGTAAHADEKKDADANKQKGEVLRNVVQRSDAQPADDFPAVRPKRGGAGRGGRMSGSTRQREVENPAPDRRPTVAEVARAPSETIGETYHEYGVNPAPSPELATLESMRLARNALLEKDVPARSPAAAAAPTTSQMASDQSGAVPLVVDTPADAAVREGENVGPRRARNVTISINILPPPTTTQPAQRPRG